MICFSFKLKFFIIALLLASQPSLGQTFNFSSGFGSYSSPAGHADGPSQVFRYQFSTDFTATIEHDFDPHAFRFLGGVNYSFRWDKGRENGCCWERQQMIRFIGLVGDEIVINDKGLRYAFGASYSNFISINDYSQEFRVYAKWHWGVMSQVEYVQNLTDRISITVGLYSHRELQASFKEREYHQLGFYDLMESPQIERWLQLGLVVRPKN